jgi:trehalose/maltose hydrolase-like predicted phosphorylase
VGSAIAYNVWQYFQVTHDLEFLEFFGAELLLEIARFWSSLAQFNEARGRYDIRGVMGPDEFHDAYPDTPTPGLANNAYTNVMAVWVLWRALDVLKMVSPVRRVELSTDLELTDDEIARWEDIIRRMFVPFHADGVISQFEGYEGLREFDWDAYRRRYRNIQRLDLILEAEHDSPNRYKLSKQPDVLMLFYVFSPDELRDLFERLGYRLEPEVISRTVKYYDSRTSQGSTLGRVVHAWVLARFDRERSLRYLAEALQSDVADVQGGTTREGVHLGAMAGTVNLIERGTIGVEISGDMLRLNPSLPRELDRLEGRFRYRGHSLDVTLTRDTLTVHGLAAGPAPIRLEYKGDVREFSGGTITFSLT